MYFFPLVKFSGGTNQTSADLMTKWATSVKTTNPVNGTQEICSRKLTCKLTDTLNNDKLTLPP